MAKRKAKTKTLKSKGSSFPPDSKRNRYSSKFDSSVIVAAIDFGTTYSGYGFSSKTSPNEVISNKNWGNELGISSYKTPTSVLVDENAEFVAFGYEAEHKYSQQCTTGGNSNYDLYRHFKMMLYSEKGLNQNSMVKSIRGNVCKALKIFAMALKFMKDHLLREVSKQVETPPIASMIKWVITVPAIWSDKAKQFMREAAFEAGLISTKFSKQLLFALEPEAAAVLCRNIDVNEFRDDPKAVKVQLKAGSKYLVVDAGGGTIDIAAHQVLPDGNMAEIACGSGGDLGGRKVDKNFIAFITKVLGEQFMKVFQEENPSDWLNFMTEFEQKKKATNIDSTTGITLQLSWAMDKKYNKVTGLDVTETIQEHSDMGISFRFGQIILSQKVVLGFFTPVVENIIAKVQTQIDLQSQIGEDKKDLDYILLVGGFSESNILYERMKTAFSTTATVISPQASSMAIVKGAVMFGHNPKTIVQRLARKTYGERLSAQFNSEKHDERKKFWHEEEKCHYCRDLFTTLIEKGEKITATGVKTFHTVPMYTTDSQISVTLFTTDRSDVVHTDEPGVEEIGRLNIDVPLSSKSRSMETRVYFGLTEIQIEFTNTTIKNGDSDKCGIDFLTDTVVYKRDKK